jgi:para-nitrobenzyl esterase
MRAVVGFARAGRELTMKVLCQRVAAACLVGSTIACAGPGGGLPGAQMTAPERAPVHYLVGETVMELMIDDPRAKAVIDKHLPGLTDSEQIGLAGGLTLQDLEQFLPQIVTPEKVAAIQADFDTF